MTAHERTEWTGRVVVVTGASSGIGRAAVLAFAARGCQVVAVARREPLLQELMQELIRECGAVSPESSYLAGDLGERPFAEHVVDETVRRYGRIDVLVNNAAIPCHRPIYEISVEEAERVMQVNFFSCLWTTFAAVPHMLRAGSGHIVNVSSFATKVVPTYETVYTASKFAMNGFSEGLWNDLRGSNIHVSLVVPGPIETEIWQKLERPSGFRGRRYPPSLVVDGIIESVENDVCEMVVPRRNPMLMLGRLVRLLAPKLARAGAARMDPVLPEHLEQARARLGIRA
jgi:short-subunit dehydrogenase